MMLFEKVCCYCSKPFTTYKPDKQFCTNACYFASKKRDVTQSCTVCSKPFTIAYRFRGNKTCSEECRRIGQSRTTSTRVTLTCEVCGKQYEKPELQAIGRKTCSRECYLSTCDSRQPDVTKQCEQCGDNFTVVFYKRDQRFCSKSCANTGEHNGMFGKLGSLTGKPSWNHGKTAETDERLAALGQKISEGAKVAFTAGERSHVGEKNPNFGRTSDTRTSEQLENYSKAAIDRIQRGVSGYTNVHHLTGIYVGKKCKEPAHFRSSWELIAMMHWDNDPNVIMYEYEPIAFKIGPGKRSIPDFLVTFSDGHRQFFEIKPKKVQEQPEIAARLALTKIAVEAMGVPYFTICETEIAQFKRQLGDSFDAEINKHKRRRPALPDQHAV